MEAFGINGWLLFIQLAIVALFIGLPIISLIDLAKQKLTGTPLVLWAWLICSIPVVGSLAYWIIKPTREGTA